MKLEEIHIRDPFILPVKSENKYYLLSSDSKAARNGVPRGLFVYTSSDLKEFDGPHKVFTAPEGFWADRNFWAPEMFMYKGEYYIFCSFKSADKKRGTQILKAPHPTGPFIPLTAEPVTPREWECLDGTLYSDDNEGNYMVFCHEWVQITDGTICATKLSDDLVKAESDPVELFKASDAEWVATDRECFVTDGPFMHRAQNGKLMMIWSSFGESGYAIGVAESESGKISGPWKHHNEPLWKQDGGHAMIFETFEGQKAIIFHQPNSPQGMERAKIFYLTEDDNTLKIISELD